MDATIAKRTADVLTVLASVAGSLGIMWAFFVKAGKPLLEWQQRRRTEIIKGILKDQLAALDRICAREEEAARALKAIFDDFDQLMYIALDNRERLNEINELMDVMGFASRDRRTEEAAHREKLEEIVEGLVERRKDRRRGLTDRRKDAGPIQ